MKKRDRKLNDKELSESVARAMRAAAQQER